MSDVSAHLFGDLELNRSNSDPEKRYERVYTEINTVDESKIGQEVWVRARVHAVTGKGSIVFVTLRHQYFSIQATTSVSETISKGMIKYIQKLTKESIVDIKAKIAAADVQKTTQKQELHILEMWCVNKSVPALPFSLDDAIVRCEDQTLEGQGSGDVEEEKKGGDDEEKTRSIVNQKVRLDNRVIDLRVPTNLAIFKLQSGVC